MNNLAQRIITGIIGAALLIAAIYYSQWGAFVVFLVVQTGALFEFYSMLKAKGNKPNIMFGLIVSLVTYSSIALGATSYIPTGSFILILPLIFSIFIVELFRNTEKPFVNIALTILGVIYISIPLGLFVMMSHDFFFGYQYELILGCLFILWANDSGAYFTGKAFGKTKLFERISPNKTWEGSIGGGVLALTIAYVLSLYFTEYTVLQWILIGIAIAIMGSLGDLIESMLKRSVDIKDSGSIIPGHGGFLDRFDGLFIAIPFIVSILLLT